MIYGSFFKYLWILSYSHHLYVKINSSIGIRSLKYVNNKFYAMKIIYYPPTEQLFDLENIIIFLILLNWHYSITTLARTNWSIRLVINILLVLIMFIKRMFNYDTSFVLYFNRENQTTIVNRICLSVYDAQKDAMSASILVPV